ncbi:helix-turn-helix transcriptional regulator [Pseudomonas sp. RIT-PI-AD]|uniref:ArsR/SmtB family transcription factor n=1 Tax=Pseudomonas sp. RIT-PI-AD TaxID=3035294 RepID=UPI0021DB514D|nr:helix-turn-helix transcriptional regulator [Pseudomonas sp. RIT-PI-AD]
MIPNHPDCEQIRLENVLTALGNPLRLAVVRALASGGERACGSLLQGQSKSTMTHHWRVLRDSGVIWQRPYGRENLLSLRREDLDRRFPGLLDSLLGALENDPVTDQTTAQHLL